jgi:hypothetical protein
MSCSLPAVPAAVKVIIRASATEHGDRDQQQHKYPFLGHPYPPLLLLQPYNEEGAAKVDAAAMIFPSK